MQTWQSEQQRWRSTDEQRWPWRLKWAIDYVRDHPPDDVRDHVESLLALLRAAHPRSALQPLVIDLVAALQLSPARWGHWEVWERELRFAIDTAERLGLLDRLAVFLGHLVHVLATLGRLDETLSVSAQALTLARQQQALEPWAQAGAARIAAYLARGEVEHARQEWAALETERLNFASASPAAQCAARMHLGLQYIDFLNRSGQNETALEECARLIQALNSAPDAAPDLLPDVYSWRGVVLLHQGRYQEALAAVQHTLEVSRWAGDAARVAGELGNLGLVYMSLGELDRAEVAYQQAIAALKELKVMGQYLNALGTLGAVYLLSGKLDKALGCLNEQLLLAKSLDYARETARALSNRGAALMYQGRYAESLDDIAACQHLFIEQNRRAMYIASLVDLGYCCVGLGELARARQAVNDALQQAEELSLPTLRLIALRCLAVIEPDQSMERLQEALSLARELERRLDEAGCLLSLAGLSADETERLRLWNEGALLLQQCGASAWLIGRAPDNPPVVALTL